MPDTTFSLIELLSRIPEPAIPLFQPPHFSRDVNVCRICDDSRQVDPETLFVCICGEKADGHAFLPSAYLHGCRYGLVSANWQPDTVFPDGIPEDLFLWQVRDTRRALSYLAAAIYGNPATQMRLIGITGTKGKTTSALMAYHILCANGQHVGYIGTNGILYGDTKQQTGNTTPGPLLLQKTLFQMLKAGIETVILEVSSQALWQDRVAGVPFAVCVFTNLSPDHIGYPEHPDFSHYLLCKRKLFTEGGAPIVLANADDPHTEAVVGKIPSKVLTWGIRRTDVDYMAMDLIDTPAGGLPGVQFVCCHQAEAAPVTLPFPGEYNVSNALCAIAIANQCGIPLVLSSSALADARVPGRFEMLPLPGGALVVIDYAHNGVSLTAVLSVLRKYCMGRLWCLFGSVGGRTACRRSDLGKAAANLADFTVLTADNPDQESVLSISQEIAASFPPDDNPPRYLIIQDRSEAVQWALSRLSPGDILLLAGKGNESSQKINGKNLPYSDRAVVQNYIRDQEKELLYK